MAETSGFFRDVGGDREYTTDFLARWIASIIGNGVYDGDLAVAAGSNMQVVIPTGRAWINGYHYRNDGDLALAIDNADGVLNRKDTVVLRWDVNARSITAQVLKGAPSSTATAPAIVRTTEQYDLKIAEISIPAGTTAITQALITDTRLDNAVCGIVTGVVHQVDTTALYNQIQSDLAGFKSTNEAGFSTWVNGLKEVLDDSTAGNLLNLINTHKADPVAHMTQAQKDQLATAVQNATIGGTAVPKSETTLQIPMPTADQVGAIPIINLPNSVNLNDYKSAAILFCTGNADAITIANRPFDEAFAIIVMPNAYCTQIAVGWGNPSMILVRQDAWTEDGIGTWSAWAKLLASTADYASGSIPLAAAGLRNGYIMPDKDSGGNATTIPTGLADGTVVLRYDP